MAKLVYAESVITFIEEEVALGPEVSRILEFLKKKKEDVTRCEGCEFFNRQTYSCKSKSSKGSARVYPRFFCANGIDKIK